jgi:hypothetical protein
MPLRCNVHIDELALSLLARRRDITHPMPAHIANELIRKTIIRVSARQVRLPHINHLSNSNPPAPSSRHVGVEACRGNRSGLRQASACSILLTELIAGNVVAEQVILTTFFPIIKTCSWCLASKLSSGRLLLVGHSGRRRTPWRATIGNNEDQIETSFCEAIRSQEKTDFTRETPEGTCRISRQRARGRKSGFRLPPC